MPDVVPFLTYEDGIAALEWLAEVFGFTETTRFTSIDGRLSHGEMSIGDGLIMLASPSPDYEGLKRHRGNCEIAASWSALPWVIDGVLVKFRIRRSNCFLRRNRTSAWSVLAGE